MSDSAITLRILVTNSEILGFFYHEDLGVEAAKFTIDYSKETIRSEIRHTIKKLGCEIEEETTEVLSKAIETGLIALDEEMEARLENPPY